MNDLGDADEHEDAAKARPEGEAADEDAPPGLRPGQGTAIVTGVISIAIGVAYLALVSVFDQRGAVLQPPPPEAFL